MKVWLVRTSLSGNVTTRPDDDWPRFSAGRCGRGIRCSRAVGRRSGACGGVGLNRRRRRRLLLYGLGGRSLPRRLASGLACGLDGILLIFARLDRAPGITYPWRHFAPHGRTVFDLYFDARAFRRRCRFLLSTLGAGQSRSILIGQGRSGVDRSTLPRSRSRCWGLGGRLSRGLADGRQYRYDGGHRYRHGTVAHGRREPLETGVRGALLRGQSEPTRINFIQLAPHSSEDQRKKQARVGSYGHRSALGTPQEAI